MEQKLIGKEMDDLEHFHIVGVKSTGLTRLTYPCEILVWVASVKVYQGSQQLPSILD